MHLQVPPVPGSHEPPMHLQGLRLRRHCLAVTEPPMHLQVPPVPGSHHPPMYCQCTCKCLVCAASAWYSRAADAPPMQLQVPRLCLAVTEPPMQLQVPPVPGSHEPPMHLQVPRRCLAVTSCRCATDATASAASAWQSPAADATASAALLPGSQELPMHPKMLRLRRHCLAVTSCRCAADATASAASAW